MPEENPRRKRSPLSPIITLIVFVGLGVACYYAWKIFSEGIEPIPAPAPQQVTQEEAPRPAVESAASFSSSTLGFSLRYPSGFTVNEAFQYRGVAADKPIDGVQFKIPASLALGTNLSPDSYLSVEQLPRATSCRGDIYLAAYVTPVEVEDGGASYILATSTEETNEGITYEEWVYALDESDPCTAVRYLLKSTAIEEDATSTQPFDRDAILAEFDKIRRSLTLE